MKNLTSSPTRIAKNVLRNMTFMNLAEKIIDITDDCSELQPREAKPYARELAERTGLTEQQAILFAVFINQCDDHNIRTCDIARHFDMRPISLLAVGEDYKALQKKRFICCRTKRDGDMSFCVPREVVKALMENHLPEPKKMNGLSIKEFIDFIEDCLHRLNNNEMEMWEWRETITQLLDNNVELKVVQELRKLNLDDDDSLLLFVMLHNYIENHDDRQQRCDIDDCFDHNTVRRLVSELEAGENELMEHKLVEHAFYEGRVETGSWKLTDYCKYDFFSELNLTAPKDNRSNLTRYEDITEKALFYNKSVTRQVDKLASLLEEANMENMLDRFAKKGMRRGFTCLFYGGPGTGKTETVLQLARRTKRDILLVDVPSIRSKWVGETEQNIKAVFDRYRIRVRENKHAPILVFNEADALLGKRKEGGENAVDKMENAMQNIILQEMENLDGIMIATTNLTANLDTAFERRFLYKIQFDKPQPEERCHIWKAMLPDLTEADALHLARLFDFSGGQIENVARKRIIDDILEGRDELSLEAIEENCRHELLGQKQQSVHIGF